MGLAREWVDINSTKDGWLALDVGGKKEMGLLMVGLSYSSVAAQKVLDLMSERKRRQCVVRR